MNIDRILGVLGVVLSLPGFLLLFFTEEQTLGAMAVLLGFVVFAAMWLHKYLVNLPPFTMKSVELRLEILDASAHLARMSKTYEIRTNHTYLTTITHRNIASDGTIQNLCWNDAPIPPANIESVLGELKVTVSIGVRPQWKTFTGKLSYELVDSFPKTTEGVWYVADFPAKVARISVQMPPGRFCRNVRSFKLQGGEVPHGKPQVVGSGTAITLTLKRPSVGTEYAVKWDW